MNRQVKKIIGGVALTFGLASVSQAALVQRLGGLAYYDDVLDVTWLADGDASGGQITLAAAQSWASGLNVGGVTGWRLPEILPINGSTYNITSPYGVDGTFDNGYNITSVNSELAHLFYVTLGNSGLFDTAGSLNSVYGLDNAGPFTGLQEAAYWSGTQYSGDVWAFDNSSGRQFTGLGTNQYYAIALIDGDVVVPVPAAVWLFGSGLLGLVSVARRIKR
jgi:hypothetical protein